jgi:hypothetical protein
MKLHINWKAGILSAIAVAILGIGFFIFIGSNIDFTCKNTTPDTVGCRIYHGIDSVITGYTDIFRSIFAPRCLGGNGPDDCLGPDGAIMLVTLLVIGFVLGNLIWPQKSKSKIKN